VNADANRRGTVRNAMAGMIMNPTPQRYAARIAALARASSPAPIACPTRTAAADATPSGTMKVSAAKVIAIWCAAISIVPNTPMSKPIAPNAPASSSCCAPIGSPMRSIRANGDH
jgi:hypothetical protein